MNGTWLKKQEDLFICGRKAKSDIATEIISFTSYWSVSISSDKVQDRSIAGKGHILTKATLNRVIVNITIFLSVSIVGAVQCTVHSIQLVQVL